MTMPFPAFAIMLHNWAVHPGTYRPDPSVMTDFNLWTFNSRVFPAIQPMLVQRGERVRIRIGNLSMHDHPMHLHGMWSDLETGDADFIPRKHTVIVQPGSKISYLVTADARGRWAYHCHLLYHMHGMFREVRVD